MTARKKHKIIIIEPSTVIQQGLKTFIEYSAEFEVIKCFESLQSFEEAIIKEKFHIIILNPSVIGVYKRFKIKNLLNKYASTNIVLVAIVYNYTNIDVLNSFDGVIDIYDDSLHIINKLKHTLQIFNDNKKHTDKEDKSIELTNREKDILVLIAKGLKNKDIANQLNLSVHTTNSHRRNITRKTGIATVSGLTLYALFNNLISQEDI